MLHNMYILGNMQEEPELKSSAFQCNPHVCEGFLSPKTCMYTRIGTLEKMLCECVRIPCDGLARDHDVFPALI